jgi:allantoinase
MTQGIYDTTQPYPRDLIGYGRKPPQAKWPGGARIAVQFVLNYEEGGENAVLHGDPGSEQFLSEMFNPASFPDRHLSMEGIYEYGSRAGVWRLLREFEKRGLPLTVFGVGMALQRHPELTRLSWNWATRLPATAGAGSATRTSTRPPNGSTCAWA